MAGVQAGRLSIEIVAEIARLQQDLDKAKRAVNAASKDIARNAKAANDNLSNIGRGAGAGLRQYSADVARLKASMDPLWAAAQKAKAEVQLLERAFAQGAITQQQYWQGLQRQTQILREARTGMAAVTQTNHSARMGMQQLGFQLNDVATQFAMGTRPMQIFAQQSGQVVQAIQLMSGGTSKFATFMGGPWGVALTVATIALTPFIAKLFDTEDALNKVGDAAQEAMKKLRESLADVSNFQAAIDSNQNKLITGMGDLARSNREIAQVTRMMNDLMTTPGGVNAMEGLNLRLARLEADKAKAEKDIREAREGFEEIRALRGVEAMQGANQDRFSDKPDRAGRERRGREGPTAEEIERRYSDQLLALTLQSLAAMQQVTTTIEERAELELRALEWNHRQVKKQIEADEDFSATQKAELTASAERLAQYQRDALEFRKRAELEQQAQQIADAQNRALTDSLDVQLALADTEAQRKELALQIFDAETAYLRAKLEAVKNSGVVSDTERRLADMQLQSLNALQGERREGVARSNATGMDRYLADVNMTADEVNEALQHIAVDGLQSLESGILDVITGVKSLGDAFRDVAQGIIADLLRIAIRRAIIAPLANMLFGGGGGAGGLLGGLLGGGVGGVAPGYAAIGAGLAGMGGGMPTNLLAGTPFGGGAASGRDHVSPGTAYTVGEHGRETFIPNVPGRIEPNGANDNGGSWSINVNVSGAMSDRQARETGDQIGRRIKRQLNGK
jgi:hypothetical protein